MGESLILLRQIPRGWETLSRTLAYFAHRRSFSIAMAEASSDTKDAACAGYAQFSRERLAAERAVLASLQSQTRVASGEPVFSIAVRSARRNALAVVTLVLFFFVFMLPPRTGSFWQSNALALLIALPTAAYTLWRVFSFLRSARPEVERADGEALTEYYGRAMLLGSSVVATGSVFLANVVGWHDVLPRPVADAQKHLKSWAGAGGNPGTLAAVGGARSLFRFQHPPPGGFLVGGPSGSVDPPGGDDPANGGGRGES